MAVRLTTKGDVDGFIEVCRQNVLALQTNLIELGYQFANPEGAVQLATDSDRIDIRIAEERYGKMPLLFRRWYESFRTIDFSQDAAQLYSAEEHPVAGLGLNCPLIFLDIGSWVRMREELAEYDSLPMADGREFIPTGGATSNCDPIGIWIPDNSVAPVLYDDGAGPVTMAHELTRALEAGGFPLWKYLFSRRLHSPLRHNPAYPEIREALMRNLRA